MELRRPSVALTIAGSDSGGGAGIQADIKTFTAHAVWGTTVVVAVTAQGAAGIAGVSTLPGASVRAQLEAVRSGIPIAAAKTGMLGTAEIVELVASELQEHQAVPLVVDPVISASDGTALLGVGHGERLEAALESMRRELLPLATIVTPNLAEAAALTAARPIRDRLGMEEAAHRLRALGAKAALVKGGHLEEGKDESPDLFLDEQGAWWLEGPRIARVHTHGTGCVLSAAITARLARGEALRDAVAGAKRFVTGAIEGAVALGEGGAVDPGAPGSC